MSSFIKDNAIFGGNVPALASAVETLKVRPTQLGNTLAVIGADILAQYYYVNTTAGQLNTSYNASGIVTWAQALSKQRLKIVSSTAANGCRVVAPLTPEQDKPSFMAQLDAAIAKGASVAIVMGGIPDLLQGVPLVTLTNGFKLFLDKAAANGIYVILLTHTPYAISTALGHSMQQAIIQLNRWIKMEGTLRRGVKVIDAYSIVAAPTTASSHYAAAASQTQAWKNNYHRGDHRSPNNLGAYYIGKAVAADITANFSERDILVSSPFDTIEAAQPHSNNLAVNPCFTDCTAIVGIKVNNGGTGYTHGAPVTFGNVGAGTGAQYTANVTGGVIVGFAPVSLSNPDGSSTVLATGKNYADTTTASVAGGTGLNCTVVLGPVGWSTSSTAPTTITKTPRADGVGNNLTMALTYPSGTTGRGYFMNRIFNDVTTTTRSSTLMEQFLSVNDIFQAAIEVSAEANQFVAGSLYISYWVGSTQVIESCRKENNDKLIPEAFTAVFVTPPSQRPINTTDLRFSIRFNANTSTGETLTVTVGRVSFVAEPQVDLAYAVKSGVKYNPGHYLFLQPKVTVLDWFRGAFDPNNANNPDGPNKGSFNSSVHPTWNSATAYVVGDRVIDPATKHVFECRVDHTNQALPALPIEGNNYTFNTYWRRRVSTSAGIRGLIRHIHWRELETTQIQSVEIEKGGYNYTSPTLEVIDPGIVRNGTTYMAGGSGAQLTAVVTNGAITDVVVNQKGTNYTPNAYIRITDKAGQGAVLTLSMYDFSSLAEDMYQLDRWKNAAGNRKARKYMIYFSVDSYNSPGAERVPHYWLVDPIYRDAGDYPDTAVGAQWSWKPGADVLSVGVQQSNLIPNGRVPRIRIVNGGTGYTNGTTINWTCRSATGVFATSGTATAVVTNGVITGFTNIIYNPNQPEQLTDFPEHNTAVINANPGGGSGFVGQPYNGGTGGKLRYHNKPTQDRIIKLMQAMAKAKAKMPIFSGDTETGTVDVTFDEHPALEMIRFDETSPSNVTWVYAPNKQWDYVDGLMRIVSYTNAAFKKTVVAQGINFVPDGNLARYARLMAKAGVSFGTVDMIPADTSLNASPTQCYPWIKAVGYEMPSGVHCDGINYRRNWIGGPQYPDETLRAAITITNVTHMIWSSYSNTLYGATMAASYDEVPIFLNSLATQAQWEGAPGANGNWIGAGFTITTAYPQAHSIEYSAPNGVLLPATVGTSATLNQVQPYSTLG